MSYAENSDIRRDKHKQAVFSYIGHNMTYPPRELAQVLVLLSPMWHVACLNILLEPATFNGVRSIPQSLQTNASMLSQVRPRSIFPSHIFYTDPLDTVLPELLFSESLSEP